MDKLWSRKQVTEEREYRFVERLGILCGPDEPTAADIELAGAECRAWEIAMNFVQATADQKAGQMPLL